MEYLQIGNNHPVNHDEVQSSVSLATVGGKIVHCSEKVWILYTMIPDKIAI